MTKSSVSAAVSSALALLSTRDRRLLRVAIVIQMATSLLDLVGVILMGLVGALSVTVVQSAPPPSAITQFADALGLEDLSSQQLVLVFGSVAAVVLLTKSVLSSFLMRRVLRFLANRQALVSARLTAELMRRPLTEIQERSSQETAYALMAGAGAATVGLLGYLVLALTEVALLIVLSVALMFFSPLLTIGAVLFFSLVAGAIHWTLGGWAGRIGRVGAETDIASLNAVQEAIAAYREIAISNRRDFYVSRVQALRWSAATVAADNNFIGQIPKYVFEAALVLGGFLLAGILFMTTDAVAAVGTLALFLVAGSRVMPSILRLQGALLGMRASAGGAQPTFALAEDLGHPDDAPPSQRLISAVCEELKDTHEDFLATIDLDEVSVTYPGASRPAIDGVSLSLSAGHSLALVGRSGAGKSTLADLMLGIVEPDTGSAMIGGLPPHEAIQRWPGGIAYVPQSVVLANGTVRENVALGLPPEAVEDEMVWEALSKVQLDTVLREQRSGLETFVGEGGIRLSGGQRQRLGLARALFTHPRLLVLDEATSALDADTERIVTSTIESLHALVTTVVIAHRLSTVKNASFVAYLDEGRVTAWGRFDEVRRKVPAFERQASLLGL